MPDVCVVTFTSPSADTTPIAGTLLPGPVPLSPLHAKTRTVAAKGRTLARFGFDLPRSIVMEPSLSRRQPRRQRASACDAAPPFGPAGSPHWGGVRIYWDGRGFEFSSSLTFRGLIAPGP